MKKVPKTDKRSKVESLQEQKKVHDERVVKLDNLRNAYVKYENGEIDKEHFKDIINKEIGPENAVNVNKIISKSGMDKIKFQEILNNTNLIEHKKPENKANPNYNPKYNLYKKVRDPPVSFASKYEHNFTIKDATSKFINDKITSDEYKEILQKEGYNTNSDEIQRVINQKDTINDVSYKDTMNALLHHKNDTFDSSKIVQKKNIDYRTKEDNGNENKESLMVHKNNGVYMPLKKKRQYFNENLNEFQSDKDLFDWDSCALHSFNPEKEKKTSVKNQGRIHARNLDLTNLDRVDKNNSCNSHRKCQYRNQSSLFAQEKQLTEPKTFRKSVRKYRNESNILKNNIADDNKPKELRRKIFALQQKSSEENPLVIASKQGNNYDNDY